MADTTQQTIGIPIGPNKSLSQGTLVTNKNGDAEWYKGTGLNKGFTPTFTSNKSNNYQWKPSPNCTGGNCPSQQEITNFYSNTSSTNTLNSGRLKTFNSSSGFNSPNLAKQLGIPGANNTAKTSPSPSTQGGNTPSTPATTAPPPVALPDNTGNITTVDTPLANPNQSGGVPAGSKGLQYPENMSGDQDKIKFVACEIQPRTSGGSGLGFGFGAPSYKAVAGPVFLSIQSPISDQNSVDWGPDTINAVDAALFKSSLDIMKSRNPDEAITQTFKDIIDVAGENKERIQRYLAGQAAGINNVLARTDNVVLNPNLELLFQGPQLRPFSFQFKLSARSQPEANIIKKIINYFKYHMAVRQEKDKLFLRAPHVFTIQYLKGQESHPGINLISPSDEVKACALTNFSVDYTPLGSYMTYPDGTMVSYTLNMQFQELTPIYDTDYTGHPIGY